MYFSGNRSRFDYESDGQKELSALQRGIGVRHAQIFSLRIRKWNDDALKSKQETSNLIGRWGTRNFLLTDNREAMDGRL
jgi:hypothetical protein